MTSFSRRDLVKGGAAMAGAWCSALGRFVPPPRFGC